MTWRVRPVAELDATADKCHFLNADYEPPIPLCGHAADDPSCAVYDGGPITDIEGLPLDFAVDGSQT